MTDVIPVEKTWTMFQDTKKHKGAGYAEVLS